MEPMNPVLQGEGRWLIGGASVVSEETGVQVDPVQARLDESSRRVGKSGNP